MTSPSSVCDLCSEMHDVVTDSPYECEECDRALCAAYGADHDFCPTCLGTEAAADTTPALSPAELRAADRERAEAEGRVPEFKVCPTCGRILPAAKFGRRPGRGTLRSSCRSCDSRRSRERAKPEDSTTPSPVRRERAISEDDAKAYSRKRPKACTKCKETKAPTEFYLRGERRHLLYSWCIECMKGKTPATDGSTASTPSPAPAPRRSRTPRATEADRAKARADRVMRSLGIDPTAKPEKVDPVRITEADPRWSSRAARPGDLGE